MAISVIIMGAAGRMGNTLVNLVQANEKLHLCAIVEKDGVQMPTSVPADCLIGKCIAEIAPKSNKAVIIDFTSPDASLETARIALKYKNPMVIGTTGFNEKQKEELAEIAKQIPLFMAPNMSIGVNALLKFLPGLAKSLGEDYDVEIVELHHNKKKDSPSGTALILADNLAKAKDWNLSDVACYHREGIIGERPKVQIGVQSIRGGDVVGVHTVYFMGIGERIEVTHQAQSRETFAQGALRAAGWLNSQQPARIYNMADML